MPRDSLPSSSAGVPPPSSTAGVPLPNAENRRILGICDDIVSFRRSHEGRLPNRGSNAPADEQRLGNHRYKLRMRCTKALGDKPSERMLNADEITYFERAVSEAMPESQSAQPPSNKKLISDGSGNPIAKKARVATAVACSGGPHPAASKLAITQPRAQPMKGSGVAQSAASKQIPSRAGRACNAEGSIDYKTAGDRKTLLLQLKRPHYNAIRDRRKLWEARPLFDGSCRQTIYDKLAVVGNIAVLQSGAGTNDRVCIAEVRRYLPRGLSNPLQDMVVELSGDLLPDVADARSRAQIYESLYGVQRCARGFVAMRFEWPEEVKTHHEDSEAP